METYTAFLTTHICPHYAAKISANKPERSAELTYIRSIKSATNQLFGTDRIKCAPQPVGDNVLPFLLKDRYQLSELERR